MSDDDLDAVFAAAGVDPAHLGPAQLADLAAKVADPALGLMVQPPRAAGLYDTGDPPPGFLEIHDREWWLDATTPDGRRYLRNMLAAAAIADALRLCHTLTWVTAVLPATATVDAVTTDDQGLYIAVRRIPAPLLPPNLSDDINPLDFTEFVEALAAAGPTVPLPAGGTLSFTD